MSARFTAASKDVRGAGRSGLVILAILSTNLVAPATAQPVSDTGLILWLDASDADGNGMTGDGPAPASKLSAWKDKSGQGNDVSQSIADHQPVFVANAVAGQPAVRFQKSVLELERLNGFKGGGQRFQIFVVMRADSPGRASPRLIDLPPFGMNQKYAGKRKGFWLGAQNFEDTIGHLRLAVLIGEEATATATAFDREPHLVEAVYAGNQRWGHYQDGTAAGRGRFSGDTTFVGFVDGARLAIGQHYGKKDDATFFVGDVAEVLIYNRVLSFNQQRKVGRYLSRKYGLRAAYEDDAPSVPQFETDILPLLAERCQSCHEGDDPKGSLALTSLRSLLQGGVSGPAIERHRAANSLLVHMVATNEMPPPKSGKPLSDSELDRIRQWIDAGSPATEQVDPTQLAKSTHSDHWAFQEMNPTRPPAVKDRNRIRSPVDAFLLAKLEANGLSFSNDADRVTLIRRVWLDVLGLLPSPEEVDAILADKSQKWFEKLVDRLLDSPHFGERWGRHWLDNVGYSDTIPLDNDQAIIKPGPGKWKYRDYVVEAFNQDKPFSQFLIEQLAGDELVDWRNARRFTPEMSRNLIATGFLRISPDTTDEGELNTLTTRYGILHRTGETVAGNLLGLTVQCCKCHDHKFEPLPQQDYYRFSAIFAPALNPKAWLIPSVRQLQTLGSDEKAELNQKKAKLSADRTALQTAVSLRVINGRIDKLPESIREDVRMAWRTPAASRNEIQKYLTERFKKQLQTPPNEVTAGMTPDEKKQDEEFAAGIAQLDATFSNAVIQAVYDGQVEPVYLLRRGDLDTPGAEVKPGLFRTLATRPTNVSPPAQSSGRRLTLAKQLTDWDSAAGALVARVRVNRVWQQLFETGIVESAANFGVSGTNPSHPELLEWLAGEFARTEGRPKSLLRLLLTSTAYRQSAQTVGRDDAAKRDPENLLFWRQRLRRLESETIRDAMLSASGRIDLKLGGPPVGIENRPDGMVVEANADKVGRDKRWRRSMYLLQRRNYHLSMLAAFDQPLMTKNCTERDSSTVVTQSLTMLNDRFVLHQAERLASRVETELKSKPAGERIRLAFRIALIREPTDVEMRLCTEAVEDNSAAFQEGGADPQAAQTKALTQVCHMLLNTSEFLYLQ